MPYAPVQPDDPRLTVSWRALRCLRIGQVRAALVYRPDRSAPGRRYTIDTVPARPGRRAATLCLVDDEPCHWLLGWADADDPRRSDYLLEAMGEVPPAMVPADEAGALVPGLDWLGNRRGPTLTHSGIRHLIAEGALMWLYGPDRRRHLFAAQLAAEAARREALFAATTQQRLQADAAAAQTAGRPYRRLTAQAMASVGRAAAATRAADRAAARWAEIEPLLPPSPTKAGSPPPERPGGLTLSLHKPLYRRHHAALNLGHEHGWFNYVHALRDRYIVELAAGPGRPPVLRELPAAWVLPWLRGVADWHGQGSLIIYRPGLERLRAR